jgi:prephenate dehydratase
VRIAFLGPRATFCEQALRSLPESHGAELVPCNGSPAVLAAVRDGSVDAGCVPIENTTEGAVPAVLDGLVLDPPLMIVREVQIHVRFAVLVRPGTTRDDIATISSHPHGIAQVRDWIAEHLPKAEVSTSTSTSEAAAQVARGDIDAAVSAPVAAQQHGLEILVDDIADNPGAVTRFALLTRPGPPPPPTGNDRTSFVATVHSEPGALLGVLSELAVRGIDLTRIESRPIKDRHAEYWFHIDCGGHIDEPAMGEALAALHRRCDRLRFLGSYPRVTNGVGHSEGRPVMVVGTADGDAFTESARWLAEMRSGGTA